LARKEMRMIRWAIGGSLCVHERNEDILKGTEVGSIIDIMGRRRLEWFGHVKRRTEREDIRVARGRPKLRWQDTVRKQWQKKEERVQDRSKWEKMGKGETSS